MVDGRTRVAVAGGGLMGLRHARVLRGLPGVELAAVVDRDSATRSRVERDLGVPALADVEELWTLDLQGLVVALPDDAHAACTVAALERGMGVLVEKPMALDLGEGRRMVQAAQAAQAGVLLVGHMLRFDPRYMEARRAFHSGRLGELLHVYARRNSARGAVDRYGSSTRLMWHVSIHDIDLVRWVTGKDVVEVSARGVSRRYPDRGHLDSLIALLTLEDGSPAVVESCWALPAQLGAAIDSRLEVVGSEGVLEVSGFEQGLMVAEADGVHFPDTTRYAEHEDRSGGGILAAELLHFIRCLRKEAEPVIDPGEALKAMAVAAAIERSIEAAGPVRPEDVAGREVG